MSQAPLSSFRIRPRFVQAVPTDRDTTHRLLLEALEKDPTFEVKAFPEFIGIHIAEPQRRFWSPRLFLSLDPEAAGGTRISGTYGPEIEIWGIFLYGYLITGLIGTFSAILGFAQRVVESDPWGFWVAGGMGGLALLLYLAAQLGQKLGAWQTFQLHQAYQAAIGGRAEVE